MVKHVFRVRSLTSVLMHMYLDADRDGTEDSTRSALNKKWEWGAGKRGAIILVNNDDDDGDDKVDHDDDKINSADDKKELAPLVCKRFGPTPPPAGWKAELVIDAADEDRIRVFDSKTEKAILGKGVGTVHKFKDLNPTKFEFGMEATQYAGAGFDGVIRLTLKMTSPKKKVHTEWAEVRVAPWIMPNHLDKALEVHVVDGGAFNSGFRADLGSEVGTAGCTLVDPSFGDIWMQDCMEVGFTNLPTHAIHTVMRPPRGRGLKDYPESLLGADFGFHAQGTIPPDPADLSSLDSNGNLEATPPFTLGSGKEFPFGRIYFGGTSQGSSDFDPDVRAFLNAQVVQKPISLDTSWLLVGHVDEMITFVPGGSKGFTLLLASPKRAYEILDSNKSKHGSSKMLIGRDFHGHPAEVTIKDFLDVGIPSLGTTATQKARYKAAALRTFNNAKQKQIDNARKKFIKAMELKPADIIDIPSLFMPNFDFPNFADALTAVVVNMLVLNKHCIPPKPFGPVVGGKDLFEEELKSKLTALGCTVAFIDDWDTYHVNLGEVHCGTNTVREAKPVKWWEFEP